jgi:membrane fusion protein (multidrug efflux system)
VVPLDNLWVDANFKETQLTSIRIGQPASMQADVYPDVTYHGKVVGIGSGTGSAFSLLPAQNASGNWIKVVQRVPVRISLSPQQLEEHPLRVGLSMSVDVDISNTRGNVLTNGKNMQPPTSTPVYEREIRAADRRAQEIIRANMLPRPATSSSPTATGRGR